MCVNADGHPKRNQQLAMAGVFIRVYDSPGVGGSVLDVPDWNPDVISWHGNHSRQ